MRILPQKDVVEGQENCTKGDGEHVQNHGEDSAVGKVRQQDNYILFLVPDNFLVLFGLIEFVHLYVS